jgi:hypothetical protein
MVRSRGGVAADLMAAVIAAVGAGRVTPSEGAEVSKMMDAFVKAYQTAELVDRSVPVKQMTDEELMRIIRNGSSESRLCLERICPVRKDRAVRFALPPVTSARDVG